MTASATGFRNAHGVGACFDDVYLLAGARTPFGKFCGALSTVSPTDLGIHAARAAIAAAGVDAGAIDQTIVANIGQASADAFFLPRHIGLYAGAPEASTALLVQRICGSGLEVLAQAAEQVALGKAQLVLGVGTDTMSRFPLASYTARQGFALGKPEFTDLLWEALDDTAAVPMGRTADNLAGRYALTRDEVDGFAHQSQVRCATARAAGFFEGELAMVPGQGAFEAATLKPRRFRCKDKAGLGADEHPRTTTPEALANLPHVFSEAGPTTAGSASGIVDGAAALLVASGDFVRAHGLAPVARLVAHASAGVAPACMGIGPVPAVRATLAAGSNGIEFFVERDDAGFGIASACIGGGQGTALLLQRC